MSKNSWKYDKYHRRPQTHQEMVANAEYEEDGERVRWGRGGRRPHDLDPWNLEDMHCKQKSWKKRRKNRYHTDKRGTPRKVTVFSWKQRWDLQEYLEDHGIPFKVVKNCKTYYYQHVQRTKQVKVGQKPNYGMLFTYKDKHCSYPSKCVQRGWIPIYRDVPLAEPIITWHKASETLSYTFTYWAEKPLLLEKILDKTS